MTDSPRRSNSGLFEGTAWHYARYRPGYPQPFFDDLVERFGLDGTGRLLDLGCGTGQLAIPLAAHVAEAVGMDPEPEMLVEAARCAQAAGVTNATWAQGGSGLPCSGAPGDSYVYRSTVNTRGSTHMVLAFMGLTSSRDVTVSRTLST
jgi:ubiquinone/menaquinone biosynthesis C-methylase UbiE